MSARRDVPPLALPDWSVASAARREHIARVTALLGEWSRALGHSGPEEAAWRDAGLWHDALRDEKPELLGPPAEDPSLPPGAWHGPAAAARLRDEGERRADVLSAITWHTVGREAWAVTGHALYCADFLEPGRRFLAEERARLAERYPDDPRAVLREVVRMRVERSHAKGAPIHPRTLAMLKEVG